MATYKETNVWQHSLVVCKSIYEITSVFPTHQRFSLSNQMQRAAVSVMSNIAEGWYRSTAEWNRFLRISYGSAAELESQLILAKELGYVDQISFNQIMDRLEQIQRLLNYYTNKKSRN